MSARTADEAVVAWAREVLHAVSGMDPAEGRSLRLIYLERRSYAQAAELMALPVMAVRRNVATGLQALAGILTATPAH